jgi:ADP-heptose:LPS heptosyltransferase
MSWKRSLIESTVFLYSRGCPALSLPPPAPRSIFVLRNNDIGDLLTTTPLFEALKTRFPETKLIAGIGSWNFDLLQNNPWVDEILPINAPWHNKQVTRYPASSLRGWRASLRYMFKSSEVKALRERAPDIGIDILGSPQGALLLCRARIPFRLGMKGYADRGWACQRTVGYDGGKHVARGALGFAEILGATKIPDVRPQIFLSDSERDNAAHLWRSLNPNGNKLKVIVAPGAGIREKCWPLAHFAELVRLLEGKRELAVVITGGVREKQLAEPILARVPQAMDLIGKLSLRETFALTSGADLVLCNSSMLMHAAAAFRVATVVLLSAEWAEPSQHQRQWGYEEQFVVLGKEKGRTTIYKPNEVLARIEKEGWV